MLACRDNGDPLQLAFVKVVIGALFSPLAMVLSVLHDYFPRPMLQLALAAMGSVNCLRMLDCQDNGDPLQVAFVKVVIGALFSPLAMVLSVLHDSFPCPMLQCGVGGYGISELPPNA
jgi:uncharacterized membrane protein